MASPPEVHRPALSRDSPADGSRQDSPDRAPVQRLAHPRAGPTAAGADFAIATLAEEMPEASDKIILRMLVAALGLYPIGTVVHLTSNEVAEVVASATDRNAPLDLPVVRLVMDARGGVMDRLVEIDLATPRPGEPPRRIAEGRQYRRLAERARASRRPIAIARLGHSRGA